MKKLYAVGRTGAHGIAVMQNGITMYLSGGLGGLFKYEDSGDGTFSDGTLYAAKFIAKERINFIAAGNKFDIEWIKLADTSISEVGNEVSGDPGTPPVKFSDIFEYEEPRGSGCGGSLEFIEFNGDSIPLVEFLMRM